MSAPGAHSQWYLARDGQQYGPLSETELGKFVELGHLQPTDLLWREGFPDWRPAMVVFPPCGAGGSSQWRARPLRKERQRRACGRAKPLPVRATPSLRTVPLAAGD
jgi:hypothetical protein